MVTSEFARVREWFTNVVQSGLAPANTEPALMRRVRVFNLSTLAMIALAIPAALLAHVSGRPEMGTLLAGLIAANLVNVYLLRRTLRTDASGHIGTAMLFVYLLVDAVSSGGFYHPNFAWLYVIPVIAATLVGARGCLIWVAICSATVVCFWGLAETGHELAATAPSSAHALTSLVSRLTAVLALGILAVGFTSAQRQLEVELEKRSAEQRLEARFAFLLHEAAAASNQSTSLDEAFRRSVVLVCQTLGWPIGQVYSTSSQERHTLRCRPIRFTAEGEHLAAYSERYRDAGRVGTEDLPNRALRSGSAIWIEDAACEDHPHAELARAAGLGAAVLIPIEVDDGVTAVLEFMAHEPLAIDDRLLGYLGQIAAQVGHAAQRALAREHMRALSFFDALTGLPNRRFFQERLTLAIEAAERKKTHLALFFLDLDGFKAVNDTLGHAVGDKLLAAVASRISRGVRIGDCVARGGEGDVPQRDEDEAVARLGGDEFTVVLPGLASRDAAAKVGRRILAAFREPFRVAEHEIFTSVSIGIALYPQDGSDMTSLLRNADIAMYHAKQRGRNNVQFFKSAFGAVGSSRLILETRLCHAVEHEELELHYQPVRLARDGHIVAAEALLRWNDSELGQVSPMEFIPVAEKRGQIGPLGAWVIRTAAAQARAWIDEGLRPIRLSVNVSGYQLRHPTIVRTIREALAQNRLEASWFELELTESTIMQDDEITNETLRELADLGVGLALDDFGTGYSSLSYLRRLPISRVKIDRSFVSEIPFNRDDCALVSAIIAMAHSLRIPVVAEGVETEAQLAFLRERECDEVQGYLFSPAVPAKDLAQMLEREKQEPKDEDNGV